MDELESWNMFKVQFGQDFVKFTGDWDQNVDIFWTYMRVSVLLFVCTTLLKNENLPILRQFINYQVWNIPRWNGSTRAIFHRYSFILANLQQLIFFILGWVWFSSLKKLSFQKMHNEKVFFQKAECLVKTVKKWFLKNLSVWLAFIKKAIWGVNYQK